MKCLEGLRLPELRPGWTESAGYSLFPPELGARRAESIGSIPQLLCRQRLHAIRRIDDALWSDRVCDRYAAGGGLARPRARHRAGFGQLYLKATG